MLLTLSLLSGFATCLGAILVVLFNKPEQQSLSCFLGLATGVMIAVIVFDLLPTAFMYGGIHPTSLGFILGIGLLYILDGFVNLIIDNRQQTGQNYKKIGYLIAVGIALHDLPEGMAIAIGYNATVKLGLVLALAIALHNIPEGMAIAAPLRMSGTAIYKIVLISSFISLFTPLGAFLALTLLGSSKTLISLLLALASGAMTYIVKDELLPMFWGQHTLKVQLSMALGFTIIFLLTFSGA